MDGDKKTNMKFKERKRNKRYEGAEIKISVFSEIKPVRQKWFLIVFCANNSNVEMDGFETH